MVRKLEVLHIFACKAKPVLKHPTPPPRQWIKKSYVFKGQLFYISSKKSTVNSLSRLLIYLENPVLTWKSNDWWQNTVQKRRNYSKGAIFPLFHNLFNISLTSGLKLHIHLWNVGFMFSSIHQIWYVDVRISRRILESLWLRDNESLH